MNEIERIQKDLNEKYTSKRLNNSKGQHIQMLNDIKYLLSQAKNNEVLDLVICRGGTKKWSSLINSVQMSQIKKCNQNKYSPFR